MCGDGKIQLNVSACGEASGNGGKEPPKNEVAEIPKLLPLKTPQVALLTQALQCCDRGRFNFRGEGGAQGIGGKGISMRDPSKMGISSEFLSVDR